MGCANPKEVAGGTRFCFNDDRSGRVIGPIYSGMMMDEDVTLFYQYL